MHPAPGIRDRRLVRKRQTARLSFAILAAKDGRQLTYVGKVGTGFSGKLIQELMDRMEPLAVDKAPVDVPRPDRKGAHYIRPELVAEIAFAEFTDEGIIAPPELHRTARGQAGKGGGARGAEAYGERHQDQPSRSGRSAKKRKTAAAEDFGIEISSPDRVIYPELGLTKKDLADYYATIEPLIMVDAADRPMT